MLFLHWYFWIAPHLVLGVCAAILWRRRLYKQFPLFASYVAFQLLGFLITFVAALLIPRAIISVGTYRWVVVGGMSIADILQLAVFYELSDHLVFRRSHAASKL